MTGPSCHTQRSILCSESYFVDTLIATGNCRFGANREVPTAKARAKTTRSRSGAEAGELPPAGRSLMGRIVPIDAHRAIEMQIPVYQALERKRARQVRDFALCVQPTGNSTPTGVNLLRALYPVSGDDQGLNPDEICTYMATAPMVYALSVVAPAVRAGQNPHGHFSTGIRRPQPLRPRRQRRIDPCRREQTRGRAAQRDTRTPKRLCSRPICTGRPE